MDLEFFNRPLFPQYRKIVNGDEKLLDGSEDKGTTVVWYDYSPEYKKALMDGLMKNLQPHQLRIMDEKAELDNKLAKLTAFIETDTFESLQSGEQERLIRQRGIMQQYSIVLAERIAAFVQEPSNWNLAWRNSAIPEDTVVCTAQPIVGTRYFITKSEGGKFQGCISTGTEFKFTRSITVEHDDLESTKSCCQRHWENTSRP